MSYAVNASESPRAGLPLIDTEAGLFVARGHNVAAGSSGVTPLLRQVLDALGVGLVLVNEAGCVLHANAAALTQCGEDAALRLSAGTAAWTGAALGGMSTWQAADGLRLASALRNAARGQWALLSLGQGDRLMSVGVAPVQPDDDEPSPHAPVALLVLGSEPQSQRLSRQFFDTAHQLTHSERGVLDALCGGWTPQEIATQGRVKISTVRTQIAAIRAKVGADSIRRLLQRVAALPPMAGVRRGARMS